MTLRSGDKATGKSVTRAKAADPVQLGLFDHPPRLALPTPPPRLRALVATRTQPTTSRNPTSCPLVVLAVNDMPDYPPHLVASVEQSIRDLPTERVLLTYRDIQDYFGVSRATVVRRMKEGLVPGIRLLHGRVQDDGPVRRLDRAQVKWLLLAVRVRHGGHAR